ncbi:hypothetical protein [Streptomyces hydrogenans]|uniref:hypothetical protein n=1 Tax=Streptomyces hydrogenans TaxID=1873719 RepID=UPI0035E0C5B2
MNVQTLRSYERRGVLPEPERPHHHPHHPGHCRRSWVRRPDSLRRKFLLPHPLRRPRRAELSCRNLPLTCDLVGRRGGLRSLAALACLARCALPLLIAAGVVDAGAGTVAS